MTNRTHKFLTWGVFACVIAIPVVAAAMSPQLAWRRPAYILAGFAGILSMVFLLVQPMLAGGYLPGMSGYRRRQIHRIVGSVLLVAVVVHVVGLWFTSPPDVIDTLLFRSPTAFSAWGVVAMWAVFAAALIAFSRRKLRLRLRSWRLIHMTFAVVTVVGSVVHALLIEGTMETVTKVLLCVLVVLITAKLASDLRLWVIKGPQ